MNTNSTQEVSTDTTDLRKCIIQKDMYQIQCLWEYPNRSTLDHAHQNTKVPFKCAKWSPDGSKILTNSDNNIVRVLDTPTSTDSDNPSSCIDIPHGETVTDLDWYPFMNQSDPATCCIAESTRDHPVHLRDTNDGRTRASYVAYDDKENLMTANSLAFSINGGVLYTGYFNSIGMFDIQRPGLPVSLGYTTPTRKSKEGMKGLISSIAVAPHTAQPAAVAYATFSNYLSLRSPNQVGLESIITWRMPREYSGKGITGLHWSPNGVYIWAASRSCRYMVGWDVRDLRGPWAVIPRISTTYQRMDFDFDNTGRYLITGEMDGRITIHDTYNLEEPFYTPRTLALHKDIISDVEVHPTLPRLMTASGQRQFFDRSPSDIYDPCTQEEPIFDNSVRVWDLDMAKVHDTLNIFPPQ